MASALVANIIAFDRASSGEMAVNTQEPAILYESASPTYASVFRIDRDRLIEVGDGTLQVSISPFVEMKAASEISIIGGGVHGPHVPQPRFFAGS